MFTALVFANDSFCASVAYTAVYITVSWAAAARQIDATVFIVCLLACVYATCCVQEDTRKALLASLQDESFNLWVRDVSSGRHPTIPPVLNWPEASDESDSETSPSRIETAASLGTADGSSEVVELNDVDLQMPGFAGLGRQTTVCTFQSSDASSSLKAPNAAFEFSLDGVILAILILGVGKTVFFLRLMPAA